MSGEKDSNDRHVEFLGQLEQVRPVTRNLIGALMLDAWPNHAAIVDFGIDSQKHYEALYYPIREGEILPQSLDEALGHGEKLTALARGAASNPHKDVEFYTSWDIMLGRERAQAADAPSIPASPEFREREDAEARLVADFHARVDGLKQQGVPDYPPLGGRLPWAEASEDRKLKAIVWESMSVWLRDDGTVRVPGTVTLEAVEQSVESAGLPAERRDALQTLRAQADAGQFVSANERDDLAGQLQHIAGFEYEDDELDADIQMEWTEDYHAARVRDYGEPDAGTYGQRVREGAAMPVTPWPAPGDAARLEATDKPKPPLPSPSEIARNTQPSTAEPAVERDHTQDRRGRRT